MMQDQLDNKASESISMKKIESLAAGKLGLSFSVIGYFVAI